jgi:hypothetical protein
MAKNTPEQHFRDLFAMANDKAASQNERDKAERAMAAWLKRHDKTARDYPTIFAKAAEDDKAQKPPPPPSDPRDDASVRFDPKRHNPASLVETIISAYVTMPEHVRVIFVLGIVFTHVYTRFSIAPRIALVSERSSCGKSIALELVRSLGFRTNNEALGTGAAIRDHFILGPGSLCLDELDHATKDAQQSLQQIYDIGYKQPGSKISLKVKGETTQISVYAPMFIAGVGLLRNFLGPQQLSRTYMLDMEPYTEETKPPRDFYIGPSASTRKR